MYSATATSVHVQICLVCAYGPAQRRVLPYTLQDKDVEDDGIAYAMKRIGII